MDIGHAGRLQQGGEAYQTTKKPHTLADQRHGRPVADGRDRGPRRKQESQAWGGETCICEGGGWVALYISHTCIRIHRLRRGEGYKARGADTGVVGEWWSWPW